MPQPSGRGRQSTWRKASRRRKLLLWTLLLAFSASVSFLAGEVVLRLLGYGGAPGAALANIRPVDDPVLDWRHVPGSEVRRGRITYSYNSAGFRDQDHAVRKPGGVTRIVVVGDSVAEGFGVELKAAFFHLIQERLGSRFEVINVAAGGLNTAQEVRLFESEALRYEPDLVVLNFVLNDIDYPSMLQRKQRHVAQAEEKIAILGLPIDRRVKRALISSALIYFLAQRLKSLQARLTGADAHDYFIDLWKRDDRRQEIVNALERLRRLQAEQSFAVLVMIWPLLSDYDSYAYGSIHEWMQAEATAKGFTMLDLLPEFSQFPYRRLQISPEDSVHPNAFAHQLAAEVFLDWWRAESPPSRPGSSAARD